MLLPLAVALWLALVVLLLALTTLERGLRARHDAHRARELARLAAPAALGLADEEGPADPLLAETLAQDLFTTPGAPARPGGAGRKGAA